MISPIFAAWTVRRFSLLNAFTRLGMGILALALLLFAEFALVLPLRGFSISEYLATRDPVAASVYYLSLVVFALWPLLVNSK